MSSVRRFTLPPDADTERFLAGLGQRVVLEPEPGDVVERTIYDTFDWRLLDADTVIERQVREDTATVVWRSLSSGSTIARLDRDDVPRFAGDLEAGPAASRLAEIIEMRALLPLTTVVTRRTSARHLDDEDKTIARIIVDEVVGPDERRLPSVIQVVPLRGYDREARRLTEVLDAQVVLTADADDLLIAALRSSGYAPGAYTSKLRTRLDPGRPAVDAWITVLRALLAAVLVNEDGVRADIDSEFLHDFRVAVRRTRSVVGEAHDVLPHEALEHFRTELKWLGQTTGPTRDLDVFLLDTADFADELPIERRRDLDAFTTFLEGRQREAQRALVADLDTERYATLIDGWTRFLDDPPVPTAGEADGSRPAPAVAAERIAQAHRRLVKRGRRITAASEPERLHDLRKDAKRLRYLLECFGSLFPADLVSPIVKDLKGVQDVLGTYQDCQVQAGQLERFAQDMLDQDGVGASAVMVIGLLVEQLDRRAAEARDGFADRFAAFDRPATRHEVRRLLPSPSESETETESDGSAAAADPDPRTRQEPAP